MPTLTLPLTGFSYPDLYDPSKLSELHTLFLKDVAQRDAALHQRWLRYSSGTADSIGAIATSQVLVDMASHVGRFVANIFGVESARKKGMDVATREKVIFKFKLEILQRNALKKYASLDKCIEVAPLAELKDFYNIRLKSHFSDNFISYDDELANAMLERLFKFLYAIDL